MKIIVGIPARNNGRCIGSIVLGTAKQVDEIIVVDDGSTDDTVEVVKQSGATLIMQEYAGEGIAIRKLIKEAKQRDADILVIIEANCEYNTKDITKVLEPIVNGEADLVIGSRFIGVEKEENKKKMSISRRYRIMLFNILINVGKRRKVSDTLSGLRALSRYAMEEIRLGKKDESVKSEMVMEAVDNGIRIKEVGIGIGDGVKISGGYY